MHGAQRRRVRSAWGAELGSGSVGHNQVKASLTMVSQTLGFSQKFGGGLLSFTRDAVICLALLVSLAGVALAQQGAKSPAINANYEINPGDMLQISVWKEPDTLREVVVLPDGAITYPLAGTVKVAGLTPAQVEQTLGQRLARFYVNRESPYVTVVVQSTGGNRIYVIGEVRSPGMFVITQPVDVIQALSMAGGLTEFANKSAIRVLRRLPSGQQTTLAFDYAAVQRGRDLSSNIRLMTGDTVLVP